MKKLLSVFILLALVLSTLSSCASNEEGYEVPEQSIRYVGFSLGNVIDDEKQAVFFKFESDYTVTKMEIAGTILDGSGNTVHSFDTSMVISSPSCNFELPIRIEADLIKRVRSVTFTKIKAYTTEKIK